MVVVVDAVPDTTVTATLLTDLLTGRDGRVLLDKRLLRCAATARGAHGRLTEADGQQKESHTQAEAGTKAHAGVIGRNRWAKRAQMHRRLDRRLPAEASSHPLPASRRQLAQGLRPRLEAGPVEVVPVRARTPVHTHKFTNFRTVQ